MECGLQEDLVMKLHVNCLVQICNQCTYLITQLKRQGLPQEQLQCVFDAIIVTRLLYAAPAWRGYLSSAGIDCIQSIQDKAKRWSIICNDVNIIDLFDKSDKLLFKSALCFNHCLHHLLLDKRHHTISLRPHGCDFLLPRLNPLTAK